MDAQQDTLVDTLDARVINNIKTISKQ